MRKISRVEPFTDPSDAGVCIAKAQLFGTLTPVAGEPLLRPNETTLWSAKADPDAHGRLVGCVLEFDVVLPAGAWFHFRTVASLSATAFGGPDDTPYPPGSHVRGWWDKSRLELQGGTDLNCDPTRIPTEANPLDRHLAICEMTGAAEHGPGGFAAMPGAGVIGDPHEFDLTNKGCFGADLEYVKGFYNENTMLSNNAYLHILARTIGQKFWGAAQVVEPPGSEADKQGVPKLTPSTSSGLVQRELVQLLEARDPARILVPAATLEESPIQTRIRVAVGGAAATPANLHYTCEQLSYTDVEEPS